MLLKCGPMQRVSLRLWSLYDRDNAGEEMNNRIAHINIGITNRCNLACRMCDIWQEKNKVDLPVAMLAEILAARSLALDTDITLTGGEPFLHEAWGALTELILQKNVRWLKSLSTNGTRTESVLMFLKDFSGRLPADFSLHISMDGIHCHDTQRGESLSLILNTIHAVRQDYPSLAIKIKFTITPWNYRDILPTFQFCQEQGLDFRVKLAEYAEHYTNKIHKHDFVFDKSARATIVRDLWVVCRVKKRLRDPNAVFVEDSIKFLLGERRQRGCQTPFGRIFIMPEGTVFSCLHAAALGNLHEQSLDTIWDSTLARNMRAHMHSEGCQSCVSYHGADFAR